jgi:hypothetical protein
MLIFGASISLQQCVFGPPPPLGWFVWCEFCPTNEKAEVDVKFDDVVDILPGKENVLLR